MSKTRSRQINDLDMADSLIRGTTSEKRVDEALRYLTEIERIASYTQSSWHRDSYAIDFTAHIQEDGWVVDMPIQVKSSFCGAWEHNREHPDIPCIVVEDDDEMLDIARKLLIALNLEHPLVDELVEKFYMCLTYQC